MDNPLTDKTLGNLRFLAGISRFQEPNRSANRQITQGFRKLAADMGTPASALAIAWLMHQGDHVIPIPGTRSVSHFHELATGMDLLLTSDDLAAIDKVLPVGWAHGDRYNADQWAGPERYS